jgi:opacity protein-like surface antigen
MDYDADVHTFMIATNYSPLPKLSFNAGASFSMAESEMKNVDFASDASSTNPLDSDIAPGTWGGTYDVANTNSMESYSNLDYTVWEFEAGMSYAINNNVGVNVSYLFTEVQDDDQYVYGDESGQYQSLMTYLTFRF